MRGKLFAAYWLLQYNPITFYLIANSGGYGITGIRVSWALFVSASFIILGLILKHQVRFRHIMFIVLGLFSIFLTSFNEMSRFGEPLPGLYVPFIEFLLAYLVVVFFIPETFSTDLTNWRKWVYLFMGVNIAIWVLAAVSGDSWGVFRAYIGGVTLNRLPDFMLPILLPSFLISASFFGSLLIISYILLTSYRTLYVGFIMAIVVNAIGAKINVRTLNKIFLLIITSIAIALFFPETKVIFERLISAFLPEDKVLGEASKSQRFNDLVLLLEGLPSCLPFGCGSLDPITSAPLYNFSFFPVWSILAFGVSALPFLLWLLFPIWSVIGHRDKGFNGAWIMVFFITVAFPYVHYFPLTGVMAFFTYLVVDDRRWKKQ
jgi:hypothetical protein